MKKVQIPAKAANECIIIRASEDPRNICSLGYSIDKIMIMIKVYDLQLRLIKNDYLISQLSCKDH